LGIVIGQVEHLALADELTRIPVENQSNDGSVAWNTQRQSDKEKSGNPVHRVLGPLVALF
jgi:hypothetical protein